MEFNMCNVIILLNKPLEEDIPFTTCSKAGRFRCLLGFLCTQNISKHAAGWGGGVYMHFLTSLLFRIKIGTMLSLLDRDRGNKQNHQIIDFIILLHGAQHPLTLK